ncbi:hypothetical protein DMUE_0552 [Dictyocoela muelleri]|nr:hypothetical protein DMUE_0552 [Dictyocoela muelleri]
MEILINFLHFIIYNLTDLKLIKKYKRKLRKYPYACQGNEHLFYIASKKLNKALFNESVYSFYCKHRRIPWEHDIVSSWEKLEEENFSESMESRDFRRNRDIRAATFNL